MKDDKQRKDVFKMTLSKTVECLKQIDAFLCKWKLNHIPVEECLKIQDKLDEALASVPEPMTNETLYSLVLDEVYAVAHHVTPETIAKNVIHALRNAGVLYCKEGN